MMLGQDALGFFRDQDILTLILLNLTTASPEHASRRNSFVAIDPFTSGYGLNWSHGSHPHLRRWSIPYLHRVLKEQHCVMWLAMIRLSGGTSFIIPKRDPDGCDRDQ